MSAQAPPPTWPPAQPPPVPPPVPRQRPQYSRLRALVLSFFSPSLYRDVVRNWRGIGLLYLLLLFALTWAPVIGRWHLAVRSFAYGAGAERQLREFPTITINKGVVSIAEEEPYVWRDCIGGEPILYVDTADEFIGPDADAAKILLGSSTLYLRKDPRETRVYDLSEVGSFFVDNHRVAGWLKSFSNWLAPMGFPTAVTLSMIWGLFRLLLYSLIGLAFASVFHARVDFAALMRLAAVAMTPGMMLDALAWTFNFGSAPFCGWSGLIGVITVAYLGFAVKSNAGQAVPAPGMFVPGYPYPGPGGEPYQDPGRHRQGH